MTAGQPPALDLHAERSLQELVVALASAKLIRSAQDCSDGGYAVALAECCFDTGGIGAAVNIDATRVSGHGATDLAAALFGESASRIIVSTSPDAADEVLARARSAGVPARLVGRTGGRTLKISVDNVQTVELGVDDAERLWSTAIGARFARQVA